MKILELFAGVGSVGNPARKLGFQVYSLDINPKLPNIDLVCDIMDFDYQNLNFIPDVIWASPECKAWSVAAGGLHSLLSGGGVKLISEYAKSSLKMIEKTVEIIAYFSAINSSLKWYIENPLSSRCWHLPILKLQNPAQQTTLFNDTPQVLPICRYVDLDQCRYGRVDKKPTRIATNDLGWIPRPRCSGYLQCGHKFNGARSNLFSTQSYEKRAAFPE
jgi:hypothetical protein